MGPNIEIVVSWILVSLGLFLALGIPALQFEVKKRNRPDFVDKLPKGCLIPTIGLIMFLIGIGMCVEITPTS